MGKRASKPTKLKLIEGNRGKREIPPEPQPRPNAPQRPGSLGRRATMVWKDLAPILERLGLLTESDGANFGELCRIVARLWAIRHETNKSDFEMVIEGKINPLLVEERLLRGQLRQFAGEFGLTPRGRVGLSVGAEKEDEGEDLLS